VPQLPQRDKHGEFKRAKPPTFSHSVEPIDADDWLKTIEKKLQVIQCTNWERVLFAAHQLVGPARDWWDAYVEAPEEPKTINWQELWNNFRTHHVSFGMMKLKKKEFEDLKQGLKSMNEYVTRFPSYPTWWCGYWWEKAKLVSQWIEWWSLLCSWVLWFYQFSRHGGQGSSPWKPKRNRGVEKEDAVH
jgi:hypothetical protein